MSPESSNAGLTWLFYSLLTVASWGVYGIFLHTGQVNMADPVNGRYKAFLFVGIAYFLTAVLAPLAVLVAKGASWNFPAPGLWWSLIAGIVGAIGAFGVLTAYAFISKRDFNALGSFFMVGLWVVIGTMVLNMFFRNPALDLWLAGVTVLVFSGLLVFDTWRLRNVFGPNDYVPAAVTIYLDLLNLFMALLRILGGRRD